MLLLCAFPPEFMGKLETHYSKYKHAEAALGLHNLSDETLRPTFCRFKDNGSDNMWKDILTITPEAVLGNFCHMHTNFVCCQL